MPVSEAPFDSKGNLMHFPYKEYERLGEVRIEIGPEWRLNVPFITQLRLVDYGRGRSSAFFVWEDPAGHTYPMFLTDMMKVIVGGNLDKGWTQEAVWEVKKRGMNYGIGLAKDQAAVELRNLYDEPCGAGMRS